MYRFLAPPEFSQAISRDTVVDIRPEKSFLSGSFPGAISFPASGFNLKEDFQAALRSQFPAGTICVFDEANEFKFLCHDVPGLIYLDGGYSGYTDWQNSVFASGPPVLILGGKAGSGKTEYLRSLAEMGEQVLDLEKLANHKGSVFGKTDGAEQQSNDEFRHRVFGEWSAFDPQQPVWIEEEGPFLGKNTIPPVLYQRMLGAVMLELEVDFEKRLAHLIEEYGKEPEAQFISAIRKLEKRMGTSANHKALHLYRQGNIPGCFALLLHYYDSGYEERRKLYRNGIQKRVKPEGENEIRAEALIAWRKSL